MQTLANAPRARHADPAPATTPDADLPTLIGDGVLAALGTPPELSRVQVKPLWGNRYRANVFVGQLFTVRLAHSYYLEVGADGGIVSASPPLKREY